jgi:hypothetical protein
MKKLLIFLALLTAGFSADAANDVVLSQRKADNSGFIQRNVAPVASGFLTFDASKIPTSPANITWVDPLFNVYGTSTSATRGISSTQYSSGTDSAKFMGRKARGSATVPTVITTGDFLTRWTGAGYDGSNFIESASIVMGSTGTIAATRVPSFISFQTGTDAAPTVMTEAFRVGANQAIMVPNTNTVGLQLYNTVDQATNYERLNILWSANVATISTAFGGTGNGRTLLLTTPSGASISMPAGASTGGSHRFTGFSNSLASAVGYLFGGYTFTATSGNTVALSLTPTYNQASGTAANTDHQILRTETAVGSGDQFFLTAGTAALGTQFSINNRGGVAVSYQSLSGAGAVNITNYSTEYTSTGVAQALTLADGRAGQIKVIVHGVDGGSGVLTPTTKTGFSTITFTNAGDSVTLQFFTTRGWMVTGSYGAVVTP